MMTLSQGLDPHVHAFLEQLNSTGSAPLESLTPDEARHALNAMQAPASDMTGITEHQQTIDVDGRSVLLHIIKPAEAPEKIPVFMFFHGGGWVLGDYSLHQRLVRDLVVLSKTACVFVDYTRAPEARFPIAIEQAYSATCWVAAHGEALGLDSTRIGVVGNSAGGNMATVVCMMAKARGGPSIIHQVLLWPVTDARFDTASYQQWAEGYFLTRSLMEWFWNSYLDRHEQRHLHLVSPLQGTREQLKGLPPALIQTAEFDVLRDEGEAYALALANAGVEVSCVRYNGLIHDFGLLNALSHVPAVRTAVRQVADELRFRLQA